MDDSALTLRAELKRCCLVAEYPCFDTCSELVELNSAQVLQLRSAQVKGLA